MTTAYILCGIQGSGKTTLAYSIEKQHGAKRYSHDEIIETNSTKSGSELKRQMHKDAVESLSKGHSVVLDALYTNAAHRKQVLAELGTVDCKKILVVMAAPYEECLRRNANRGNPIPEETIAWTHALYQQPKLSEGWDEIIEIKPHNI